MVHASPIDTPLQEELHFFCAEGKPPNGVIAIHSTALGPAAGGCRLWMYDGQEDMVEDALRLAKGMSYKNAMAGLPFGGGKAVIRRPAGDFDRTALLEAFGQAVAGLDGRYVTAEDVGTSVADMELVRHHTRHVAGLSTYEGRAGGDPSPWTALGVFQSMEVAARHAFGSGLSGLTVAVQGTGNVGSGLCRLLKKAGARLIVADLDTGRAARLAKELDASLTSAEAIVTTSADILAPCALGGVVNAQSAAELRVGLVCGGANNQLATANEADTLLRRGIVYAPDYVVNAGGIINVSAEYLGETTRQVSVRVEHIATRLAEVLESASRQQRSPVAVANDMAESIMAQGRLVAA